MGDARVWPPLAVCPGRSDWSGDHTYPSGLVRYADTESCQKKHGTNLGSKCQEDIVMLHIHSSHRGYLYMLLAFGLGWMCLVCLTAFRILCSNTRHSIVEFFIKILESLRLFGRIVGIFPPP